MKEKIENSLRNKGNWKKFLDVDTKELKEATILSINVTTFRQEDYLIYFDVSIVYKFIVSGQKQSYTSGIAFLNKKGNITKMMTTFLN